MPVPFAALIRNLDNLSKVGLLAPGSEAEARVVSVLGDAERLRRARAHPGAVYEPLEESDIHLDL